MKKQNKQICSGRRPASTTGAFTLVELIVVITILAILGTIAFISLQGYSASARDSKRVSDISNIKKSLELFSLNTGKYPKPDDYFTVKYGSQDLRYQGIVGDQVSTNLSRNLNEKPVDPLTEAEYTYSRTFGGNEYEVLSIYESDLISSNVGANLMFAQKSYAAPSSGVSYPKISGNYNGVYVKAGTTYIPTPSIINGNIWGNIDLSVDTTALESQVITGGDNVPLVSTGGLVGMKVEIFSGTLDTDNGEDDNGNKKLLAQSLIDAYSGTILAGDGVYKEIVETESGDLVSLVDNFVLNSDNFVNVTYSCIGTLPNQNVTTSNDTLLASDKAWQNTTSGEDCYYECSGGYTGDNCDVEPNPYLSCTGQNTPTPFSATTTYPGCDTADIIVCSGSGAGYAISACNVGSTIASLDWEVSGGEYFQWGRNKGFAYEDTSQQLTQIPSTSYDSNNDVYLFVRDSYDWIVPHNDNLWGDNSGTGTDEQRQGPCAIGYHVPSRTEWSAIVTAGEWEDSGSDMQIVLKLPYSGLRKWISGNFKETGSYGYYWSSSPKVDDATYSYLLKLISNSAFGNDYGRRASGLPVRCFKN